MLTVPTPLVPMAPTVSHAPFHRDGWVYEEAGRLWRLLEGTCGVAQSSLDPDGLRRRVLAPIVRREGELIVWRHAHRSVLLVLLTVSPALGWGNEGHQAIAEAAQSRLTNKAEAALAKVLIGGTSVTLPPGKLASVATWPDQIRARKSFGTIAEGWDKDDIQEADAFNKAHKTNAGWRFVDLPLGAASYSDAAVEEFRSKDDIVHAINNAIGILESPSPPAKFSKAHAVRWLVHLVGDLHQPMHVATG